VINPTVDHAGLSELLKPCLIVSALRKLKPEDNSPKPKFHLKTFLPAADSLADLDATEDIPQELGNTSEELVSLLETCTVSPNGAQLIH